MWTSLSFALDTGPGLDPPPKCRVDAFEPPGDYFLFGAIRGESLGLRRLKGALEEGEILAVYPQFEGVIHGKGRVFHSPGLCRAFPGEDEACVFPVVGGSFGADPFCRGCG